MHTILQVFHENVSQNHWNEKFVIGIAAYAHHHHHWLCAMEKMWVSEYISKTRHVVYIYVYQCILDVYKIWECCSFVDSMPCNFENCIVEKTNIWRWILCSFSCCACVLCGFLFQSHENAFCRNEKINYITRIEYFVLYRTARIMQQQQ